MNQDKGLKVIMHEFIPFTILGSWITLLTSLLTLCSDSKAKTRGEGTKILFEILKVYGKDFSKDFWQVILRGVIKPLFDDIQFYFQSKRDNEIVAYNDSCRDTFSKMIEIYDIYYEKLSTFTEDLLEILMQCIENPKGNLAKISINALKQLLVMSHVQFSEKEWTVTLKICSEIIKNTTPFQLLDYQVDNSKTSNSGEKPHVKNFLI